MTAIPLCFLATAFDDHAELLYGNIGGLAFHAEAGEVEPIRISAANVAPTQ
jgi:hypothetical protein